ncbi:MAG TPA: SLBB domain-containing protein [Thermoanaerobaculaceae bacterium]|nr:SLBB domain-containing protein [Thermoanaerobaculaceae bacterium]
MKRTTWIAAALLLAATIVAAATAWAQALPDADFAAERGLAGASRQTGVTGGYSSATVRASLGPDETAAGGLYSLPTGRVVTLSGPVDPSAYRLGPGDILLLQMWGKLSRSVPIEVGPEGTVLIPGAAVLKVAGRSLSDVREEVLRLMGQRYRDVSMDLRLARPRTFRVYLTGQVEHPGPVDASGALRVGDVVTQDQLLAGASHRRIDVRHSDGAREFCDLDLFLQSGDASLNPWLRDGDVIHVPTATEFVWAQGAVARAGRYEVGACDSLLNLLMIAGDPLPAAEANRALLVRFKDPFTPESLWVSLADIYSRRVNPRLEDGERLYVYYVPEYHQQHEAAIMGEVQRPGVYPIREGRDRLSQLVGSAGGFRATADLSAIRVHRMNASSQEKDPELDRLLRLSRRDLTSTEYEILRTKLAGLQGAYRVDWSRLQADRDLDLLLLDGDTVFVERLVSSIRVDGEVRRPGMLNYAAGTSVHDYVKQAGGFTDRAWQGKVRVTRAVTGQTMLAHNVRALDPGDFIWVPEKPDVTTWEQARDVLTSLASVATIVIAIQSVK